MAMTGDAYTLRIEIEIEGAPSDLNFEEVEVTIAGIRKTMSSGEINYDEEKREISIPFTQEETFKLRGKHKVDVRVKFAGGDVIGTSAGYLEHHESQSKQVI